MVKRTLWVFGIGVLALLLTLACGFGFLQTGPGEAWFARQIGRALSDPQQQVTVSGIDGFVPFDVRVREIVIADAAGPRLTASDIHLAISAADLLARRLVVRQLAIGRVAVLRPGEGGGATDWRAALHPPLALSVEEFEVGTIELAAPVIGTAMNLSAHGSSTVGDGRAAARLTVRRSDAPGSATFDLAFGGAPPRLRLSAQVHEPTGTVLAALLHRADTLPLALDLEGEGPLDDWRGKLHASAGGAAALDATFRIAGSAPYRLSLTAEARAAQLLPPEAVRVLGDRIGLTAEIGFASEKISVERLRLTAASFGLDGEGSFALANDAIAGTAHLDLPDLARLVPSLGGKGEARVTFGGTMAKPSADATLDVTRLRAAGAAIAEASASFRLRPDGDPRSTPLRLEGSGRIAGVALSSVELPPGLGDAIDWRITARVDPRTAEITADTIEIGAAGATLAGSATATPDGAAGTMRLSIPELARFDGGALAGALVLAADFRATRDGSTTATLSGAIERPRSGTAQLDALLGSRVELAGTVERRADGAIEVKEITATGAAVQLAGAARRAADEILSATFQMKLPKLAALDPRLAGAATVAGKLAGPSDALAGGATIEAPSLVVAGVPIEALTARIALKRLAPLALSLDATLRAQKIDVRATAEASYADGALRIGNFGASAAGARVEGSLSLAGGRINGKLAGDVPDLRPWSDLAGMPLAGRARIDAQASGDRVTAKVEASDMRAGSATVRTAKLGIRGDRPGRFALDLAASGTAGARFDLTGGASLTVERDAYAIEITRLQGTLDDTPVALRAPLAITWRGDTIGFSGLALAVADGSISGEGAAARSALSLRLRARDLPVAALARFGGADVSGTLGFELSVSGTRAAPQGTLIVDGENLRFAAANRPDLPALGAVADGAWRDGRVEMKGRLAGPRGAAIGWTASAPLVLEKSGFAFSLPHAGAVRAHLEGEGALGAFSDLLPGGEDRIDGTFAIDVSVVGTVGKPDASGRITIANGRYENLVTGAILTNMRVTLEGQRDRLVLRAFAAADAAGGSVSASGAVDLAASGGPTLAFSAALQRMRVLNRDEGRATASGELRLSGPIGTPRLDARLTIDQAELAVPERLPQSSRPVQAVVIDSATGSTITSPETARPSPLLTLALNVQVEIPGKTFVRGRGLDSEWRGRVQIAGTAAAPEITGRLEVVRGSYDFLGKNAVLSKGVISFSGGRTIDPTIDIQARVPSSGVTAIVAITGTALQPTIRLTSEPALPRDEILSRVLFGTSMSQIGPAQGLEIASTAASLAGGGGLDVLSKVRRGLGLDRLALGSAASSVVPGIGVPAMGSAPGGSGAATGLGTTPLAPGAGASGAASVGGTTLSAGKYVANGVYVGVNQGLQASSSTVTVEIDVSRHISIETQAGQASGTGVGLNWKLDY